jgi:hypothetical protein
MGGFKKGIWIARDEDGMLYAYPSKPEKRKEANTLLGIFVDNKVGDFMKLPSSWYKNVKFKNSPVFIPIPEQLVEQQIK